MRPDPLQRMNGTYAVDGDAPTGKLPRLTPRSDRSLYLGLCCVFALLTPLVVLVEGFDPLLRLLIALPMVVVVPGYAIMAAACPGSAVSGAERLALSLGVSLAVTVLGGLLLNLTPWGLQPVTWSALLGLLTLTSAVVAIVGGRWLAADRGVRGQRSPASAGIGVGSLIMLAVSAGLLVGALSLARVSAATRTEAGFTQIWMLSTPDSAEQTVRLGVNSQEEQDARYALRLEVDGAPLVTWSSINLAPGESWETTAALPAPTGEPTVAEARLYRVDDQSITEVALSDPTAAYRRVVFRR